MSTLKVSSLQHPSSATANLTLTSAGNVQGAGLDLIASESFSAVSSVSVNSCFSSTYENYRILLSAVSTSNGYLDTRMRTGSDDTGSTYQWQSITANGGTPAGFQTVNGSAWQTIYMLSGSYSHVGMDVYRPNIADNTSALVDAIHAANTVGIDFRGFRATTTTQYTGISFIAGAGTITGTIWVYGYRD